MSVTEWIANRIQPQQRDKYLSAGNDFIDDRAIDDALQRNNTPQPSYIAEILQKSLSIQTLDPDECAALLQVRDPDLIAAMEETALKVKKKVYDNRIVTFAPLYMSSKCVNNCEYCSFRKSNTTAKRRVLSSEQITEECRALAGKIGHKRLIVVYGEHPDSDIEYIAESIKTIYRVKEKTKNGWTGIRRVNVNAPPLSIDHLQYLKEIGIGTYQVFQETYDRAVYQRMHPADTIKSDYRWRLYSMHRALEAGIDDVGIGALFGLADWRFEVMGLLYHARELEKRFGVGPHTISFPRIVAAENAPAAQNVCSPVSDQQLRRIITVIRLAVPHTGMILTARENAALRRSVIPLGITQTDASSKIGLGAYAQNSEMQKAQRQQFILGDTRSLDEVVGELASMGFITSFCTAGYRCGRTGTKIMELLRSGTEGVFCKLNAVITFREWLDDFASEQTKMIGEQVVEKEMQEIRQNVSAHMVKEFLLSYEKTKQGTRDLYF